MGGNGTGQHIEPVITEAPPPAILAGKAWLCEGPDGCAMHAFNGLDADTGKKRFRWEAVPGQPHPLTDRAAACARPDWSTWPVIEARCKR